MATMRPLKFRAWDGKRMWIADPQDPQTMWAMDIHRDALMQFTGLTDKNGVEIYEDDLILLDAEFAKNIGAGRTLCKIGFYNGAFMFGRSDIDPHHMNTYLWIPCELKALTVVGNIHQTPAWDAPQQSETIS